MLAPTGTPQAVVDTLSREIMAAAKDPAFLGQLARLGVDPMHHTPAQFAQVIAADAPRWRDIIKSLGLSPK
jgi:tripartite-type tricarboxylate transporter receptor subunit TctC